MFTPHPYRDIQLPRHPPPQVNPGSNLGAELFVSHNGQEEMDPYWVEDVSVVPSSELQDVGRGDKSKYHNGMGGGG